MARSPSFAGVILAAGDSSRMGRDKALLPLDGRTFLEAAMSSLRPYTEMVLVVAGTNADALRPPVNAFGASLVINKNPERGQFSSLQLGLQEVLNHGRDGAIVTLVDRPAARLDTIALLRGKFLEVCLLGKWAVVPEHGGKHGHPIVIGREMIEAFVKAAVTSTARDVEHLHQDKIEYVAVNDPNVALNIDTPEDYAQLPT